MTTQPIRAASSASTPKTTSRAQLTPEQRTQKQLSAKIKRLNMKLAKVKGVAVNMHSISTRNNQISASQTEAWSKQILDIINGN